MCVCKMPPSDTHLNVLDLCRLCLGKDNSLTPVFNNSLPSHELSHKISVCLAVEIKNEDEVSQKICNHCLSKVNSFFDFRSTTLECQKVLQRWACEANQALLNFEYDTALNNKDTGKGDKEKLSTEHNKTSESDESEIEYDSRSDSESSNSERNDDSANKELSSLLKSLDSSIDASATDVIIPEREVPGPSGVQPSNEKSSLVEEGRLKETVEYTSQRKSKLECDQCPSELKTDILLKDITEEAHPTDVCHYGGKFICARYLSRHEDEAKQSAEPRIPSKNSELQCSKCTSVFKNDVLLKDHIKEAHSTHVCYCGAKFTSARYLARHEARHNAKPTIPCKLCDKLFITTSEMKDHMKSHEVGEKLHCNLCNYVSLYKSNLVRHLKRHNKEYAVYCGSCNEGFFCKDELNRHQIKKHGAEPFSCTICRKSFTSKSYLNEHNKTMHFTTTKDFLCEECGKAFKTKTANRRHMKIHLGLKYKCHMCKKSVNSPYSLKKHIKVHLGEKNVVCHICGKAFVDNKYMAAHLRTHSGERPYECTECGKRFTQPTTLKIHLRYHTGERPYLCQHCGVSFVTNSLLTNHIKSHSSHFLST